MSRTLRLTLTKHWFDMFKSGYKIEELREIKPYWVSRLCKNYSNSIMTNSDVVDNQYTEGGDNTNGWRFGSGISRKNTFSRFCVNWWGME